MIAAVMTMIAAVMDALCMVFVFVWCVTWAGGQQRATAQRALMPHSDRVDGHPTLAPIDWDARPPKKPWGPQGDHRNTCGWVAWIFLGICCPWRWTLKLSEVDVDPERVASCAMRGTEIELSDVLSYIQPARPPLEASGPVVPLEEVFRAFLKPEPAPPTRPIPPPNIVLREGQRPRCGDMPPLAQFSSVSPPTPEIPGRRCIYCNAYECVEHGYSPPPRVVKESPKLDSPLRCSCSTDCRGHGPPEGVDGGTYCGGSFDRAYVPRDGQDDWL